MKKTYFAFWGSLVFISACQGNQTLSGAIPNSNRAIMNPITNTNTPQRSNRGALRLLWMSSHISPVFSTQATKEDIAKFRVSLDGEPIRAINQGQPASREISLAQGGQQIANIPPGIISVRLEALDKQNNIIGTVQAEQVTINAGKTTKLNLEMKLIDSVVEQAQEASVGHLEVNLNIVDGKLIQKGAIIKPGDFLRIEADPVAPTGCQNGIPDFTQLNTPSAISIPLNQNGLSSFNAPPALNLNHLPDLKGSSTGILLKDIDLSADLDDELSGASTSQSCNENIIKTPSAIPDAGSTSPTQNTSSHNSNLPTKISLDLPSQIVADQFPLDLESALKLDVHGAENFPNLSQTKPDFHFLVSDPSIASINPQNQLIPNFPGITQVIATGSDGSQVSRNLTILPLESNGLIKPPDNLLADPAFTKPDLAIPPQATLKLKRTNFVPQDTLELEAVNPTGTISSFKWTVEGTNISRESIEPSQSFILTSEGNFNVRLQIKAANGNWIEASNSPIIIQVKKPVVSNQNPLIKKFNISPTEGLIDAGTTKTLQLTAEATDPENQALKYQWYLDEALVGSSPNFSIDVKPNTYQVRLVVSDAQGGTATQSGQVVIRARANQPPRIDSFSVTPTSGTVLPGQNLKVTFRSSVKDPEGQPLTFVWLSNGNPVRQTENSEMDLGPGTHLIRLSVKDPQGLEQYKEATVVVTQQNNQAPIINEFKLSPGSQEVKQGQKSLQTFQVTARDPENQPLTYTWSSNGTLIGSQPSLPFSLSPGSHLIKVSVKDSLGATTSKEQLVLINEQANRAPILQSFSLLPGSFTVEPGGAVSQNFTASAIDPDGDNLQYEWSSNGTTISNRANTTFSLNRGNHLIRFKAFDGRGGKVEKEQLITVQERPYTYQARSSSVSLGGGKFGQLLRFRVEINGSNARFVVAKQDGSAFSSRGPAYLQVGGYQNGNTVRATALISANATKEVVFTDNFSAYGTGWPKDYYVRIEAVDGQNQASTSWVGPIWIERR